MTKSTIEFDKCSHCDSTCFPLATKALCTKCYQTKQKIKKMSLADNLEPFRLKYLGVLGDKSVKNKSLIIQKNLISNAIEDKYLRHLKLYGKIQSKLIKVDVLLLENIFNEIGKRVTHKERMYTNDLMLLTTRFNESQRQIIALKLLKMLVGTRR